MHLIIKKAFTLIELLVVIAIIGILSGLIVVSLGGMTDKATIAKSQVFSNSLRNSLMMNLVSEWKFNDVSGTIGSTLANGVQVNDSWSINNGTTSGGPILKDSSECVSGKCLSFDGVDDFVSIGSYPSLTIADQITIEYWVNVKGGSSNGYCTETVSRRSCYDVCCSDLYSVVDGHGDVKLVDGTVPKANVWYHVAYTYDSNTKLGKFFLNGQLNNTRDVSALYPGYSNYKMGTSCSGLTISNDTYRFNGLLDEIRIYNIAMSISQIKESYYSGLKSLLSNGTINSSEYYAKIQEFSSIDF